MAIVIRVGVMYKGFGKTPPSHELLQLDKHLSNLLPLEYRLLDLVIKNVLYCKQKLLQATTVVWDTSMQIIVLLGLLVKTNIIFLAGIAINL